jgi:hypothetical protein
MAAGDTGRLRSRATGRVPARRALSAASGLVSPRSRPSSSARSEWCHHPGLRCGATMLVCDFRVTPSRSRSDQSGTGIQRYLFEGTAVRISVPGSVPGEYETAAEYKEYKAVCIQYMKRGKIINRTCLNGWPNGGADPVSGMSLARRRRDRSTARQPRQR